MRINGYFGKYIHRNEKTGYSQFTIINGKETYICNGIIPFIPYKMPLYVEGILTKDNSKNIINDISDIFPQNYDYMLTNEYISTGIVKGFGTAKAKKLMDKFKDEDIFAVIYTADNIESLRDYYASIDERKIIESIRTTTEFIKLYKRLINFGGNYYNAKTYFDNYSTDSMEVINKNPYTLTYAGLPFSVCETIAIDNNIPEYDKRRIDALVYDVVDSNNKNGNTRIKYKDIVKRITQIEDNIGLNRHSEELFIKESLINDRKYALEKDSSEEIYVYKKEDFDFEESIVKSIKRIEDSKVLSNIKIDIANVEKACNIEFSSEQKEALNCLNTTGIKIIIGGPGTGKTTFINGIINAYTINHSAEDIILCSPTGRAAKRMSEVTGYKAYTIHHLLKIMPYNPMSLDAVKKLDANLIIADEGSMLDTYMFARLLMAVPNNAILLIIGDANQLPSVNAGNVLHDLIKSQKIENYCLKTVYRQKEVNVIVRNGHKIINGDTYLEENEHFEIIKCSNHEDMLQKVITKVKHYEAAKEEYNVYSPVRKKKFDLSTTCLNSQIKKAIRKNTETNNYIWYGDNVYEVNDHIIFMRNNYDKGYYNGQDGIITLIQKVGNTYYVTIYSEDTYITISSKELDDLELGYAITAHKSQGSEIDNAIIVIPSEPKSMLLRKILYVEVTRAKRNVTILSEDNSLKMAISSYREYERNTGLCHKIIKELD